MRGLDLRIGGLVLRFRASAGHALAAPASAVYAPFVHAPGNGAADVDLEVRAGPAPAPCGPLLFDSGDAWTIHAHGDRHRLIRLAAPGLAGALWTVLIDADLRHGRVFAGPALTGRAGVIRHLVQYPLDQILTLLALARRGGLLLHAAGCAADGAAIVFPGVSGAGKSTLTGIAGAAQRWLSDDRIIVRADGAGDRAYGTPWPGDAGVACASAAPLAALAFVDRTAPPGATRLDPGEALERLLPVASVPWFDPALVPGALDACARVIERYPAYVLGFTLDPQATRATLARIRHAGARP